MSLRAQAEVSLSLVERGRAFAAVRLLGSIAAGTRLRSPAVHKYLERLHDPVARAVEAEALHRSVPAQLSQIDASWYTPPPPSRSPAAQRFLERVAYGRLVPMVALEEPPSTAKPQSLRRVERLLEGPIEQLHMALHALGRRRIAIAFTGAPRSALAQLLARLGEPSASELVAEVRGIPPGVSAEEVKSAQRALFRSGPEPAPGEPAALFFRRVGCGWIAPLVDAEGDRAHRLAQRLPRALGEIILREQSQTEMTEAARATIARICGSVAP